MKLRTDLEAQAIEHGLNPLLAMAFNPEQLTAWIEARRGRG